MKRSFDLLVALIALIFLLVPLGLIALVVRVTSQGPIIYWSDRVGQYNKIFKMPKFRTMRDQTPEVATHLINNPKPFLTPVGSFLRKFSFDELPQLWSIVVGSMSFVGPRPALFNQDDLNELRTEKGIHNLIPGLTGWAQVNGRDDLTTLQKVELDVEYMRRKSFLFDAYILWLTILKVADSDDVSF